MRTRGRKNSGPRRAAHRAAALLISSRRRACSAGARGARESAQGAPAGNHVCVSPLWDCIGGAVGCCAGVLWRSVGGWHAAGAAANVRVPQNGECCKLSQWLHTGWCMGEGGGFPRQCRGMRSLAVKNAAPTAGGGAGRAPGVPPGCSTTLSLHAGRCSGLFPLPRCLSRCSRLSPPHFRMRKVVVPWIFCSPPACREDRCVLLQPSHAQCELQFPCTTGVPLHSSALQLHFASTQ